MGITIAQAEETLDFDVMAKVPSEGRVVVPALNEGIPFVVSNPTSKASMAVQKLADIIMQGKKNQKIPRKRSKKMFGRLFKQR
jgi:pilus assembly protein CpaE